jgi:hypothetical protein
MNHGPANAIKPKRIAALSRQLNDELLVYDARTNKGHCLNQTAAAVWIACDGKTSVNKIVTILRKKLQADFDEQIVCLALDKLEKAGLLLGPVNSHIEGRLWSRREVMRGIAAISAVGLPVITSILVPTAAQAASCFPLLHICTSNGQCCSGHCGVNLVCIP